MSLRSYVLAMARFSRDVRLFFLSQMLLGFAVFGGIYAVLLNLFLVRLGYGPEFVGLVNGLGLLMLAVFAIPSGGLEARFGARRLMILGLAVAAAGLTALPFGELLHDPWRGLWLIACNAIAQAGQVIYFVSATPFLSGATPPGERIHAFAMQTALWPLAGFFGSLAGGVLPSALAAATGTSMAAASPYRLAMWVGAGAVVLGTITLAATGRARPPEPATARADDRLPMLPIALIALAALLRVGGEGIARTFFNVYLDTALHAPTVLVGVLVATAQLVTTPFALVTPLLALRWGNPNVHAAGTVLLAVALLPLALAPHVAGAAAGFIAMSAMSGLARPTVTAYSMEIVAPRWRGLMSAGTSTAIGLSWGAAGIGGGYFAAAFGYGTVFLLGSGITLAGAVVFWAAFVRASRRQVTRGSDVATAGPASEFGGPSFRSGHERRS
ncbi:MAG: MFS transporter [Actinobacteria bacterium]|nr:MFS transporter [Actinomycetota bacterium]